ncbi:MAG: PhzF family phenazine biosynthesis protein [Chlamydiales bacterium]|nr:PhzF family phenazine biosynthesis protein [Chlamydiales bacterium]
MEVFIVDAFTSKPFKGNPAAVVIVEEFPSDFSCLEISAEMNLSETAFVKPLESGRFHIRWFTPLVEVKLCGHATLATSHILFERGYKERGEVIHFDSLSGPLFVEKSEQGIVLNFPLQPTGNEIEAKEIQKLLQCHVVKAVQACDDMIVELENEDAVRTLDINFQGLMTIDCRGIIVTGQGKGEYDFVSRFFAPSVGVNEDPVTGSAHCKLAFYWMQKLKQTKFKAYQASKRGGELLLEVQGDRLLISGSAVTILAGNFLL